MAWYCWLTFLALSLISAVQCVPKKQFYPYGADNGDLVLMPNDEGSSDELVFSKPFVFFQVNHKKAYVNVNGLITFDSDISYFQNQELTEFPHSLIAAFYADVDTHDKTDPENVHGNIYYRWENVHSSALVAFEKILRAFIIRRDGDKTIIAYFWVKLNLAWCKTSFWYECLLTDRFILRFRGVVGFFYRANYRIIAVYTSYECI